MSIEIECQYCGTMVIAERSSRKFCSDSCKTLACRKRRVDEIISEQMNNMLDRQEAKNNEANEKWSREFEEKAKERGVTTPSVMSQAKFDAELAELRAKMIQKKVEKEDGSTGKETTTPSEVVKSSSRARKNRERVKKAKKQNEPGGLLGFISGFTQSVNSFKQSK